jgi:serine protease Do
MDRTFGLCTLIVCLMAAPAASQEPTRLQVLSAFQEQLQATYATVAPSIACIVVSRSEHYPKPVSDTPGKLGAFDPHEFIKANPSPERKTLAKALDLSDVEAIPDHGYVGGVVIDSSGLVLTPYHAIEGATKIYVFLPGRVGSYADIHAADARCDLAVLKLITPPPNLKPIKIAEVRLTDRGNQKATLRPQSLVMLLANPYTTGFALDKPSGAWGSITTVRYRVPSPSLRPTDIPPVKHDSFYKFGFLLEHDIRLNAAVTGGVLVNLNGEMVGLTISTATAYDNRALGPGYAIPTDENFRRALEVLRRGEEIEYGFLGVTLGQPPGIVIGQVTRFGPADLAGIGPNDIITAINDQRSDAYEDLLLHVGFALAGGKVKLTVQSPLGRQRDVEVTLGKWRHSQPFIASVRPEPVYGLRVDYSSILALQISNNPLIDRNGGVPPGVCVREVIPDSPAAARFKTLGDSPTRWLITQVNDIPISTPAEFYKATKGQKEIKLKLIDPTEVNRREREITLP